MRSDADILTVEQAAALLRLKPSLVRSMAARDLLPAGRARTAGSDWHFSRKELGALIEGADTPATVIVESPPAIPAENTPRSRVLTVEQAADLLQVRPKTVRALASGGMIPAAKLGKFWRFDEQLLREWLVQRSRENERAAPTTDVQPLLGRTAIKAAAGSLGDRLDQLLASPPAPPAPDSRGRRPQPNKRR